MDATISLRTSGPKNNWFSKHLQGFSIGSFRWVVLFLGISVLGLFAVQVAAVRTGLQPVGEALAYLQEMQALSRQVFNTRLATEQYLANHSQYLYTQGEQSFAALTDTIEQMMWLAPPDNRYALTRLEQAGSDYLNAFRSLHRLTASSETTESQQVIHQQLVTTGAAFEQHLQEGVRT